MSVNLLKKFEQEQLARLSENKDVPDFRPGDTVEVHVEITDGNNSRVQIFKGLCIARRNRGFKSSLTVRKISNGEGVERVFPIYSPKVKKIVVVRRGVVRRAKLYYMRELTGKAARIKEKRDNKVTAKKEAKAAKKAESKKTEAKAESKTAKTKTVEAKATENKEEK